MLNSVSIPCAGAVLRDRFSTGRPFWPKDWFQSPAQGRSFVTDRQRRYQRGLGFNPLRRGGPSWHRNLQGPEGAPIWVSIPCAGAVLRDLTELLERLAEAI